MRATSSPRRSPTSAGSSSPGITTGELDVIAGAFIAEHGGVSASKGYHGTYPAEICISPNSMVVHGIPGPYRVAEGDLLTIDVGGCSTARSPTAPTRSVSA